MTALHSDSLPTFQCEVTPAEQGYAANGTFHLLLPLDANLNELDQIERSTDNACATQRPKKQ